MTVSIRAAVPGDAALVFALIRELAAYERLAHEVDATEAMIAEALFGESPRVFCDLAEVDGEPAGFALWFYNFSSFRGRHGLYLEDLFVRPAYRRRGIATRLFRHLARRCVEENLARFEWAVLDWNEPAIGFYRALGAVGMDEWRVQRLSGEPLRRLGSEP